MVPNVTALTENRADARVALSALEQKAAMVSRIEIIAAFKFLKNSGE